MDLIPSFAVDHTNLQPGIYVSRQDEVNGAVMPSAAGTHRGDKSATALAQQESSSAKPHLPACLDASKVAVLLNDYYQGEGRWLG